MWSLPAAMIVCGGLCGVPFLFAPFTPGGGGPPGYAIVGFIALGAVLGMAAWRGLNAVVASSRRRIGPRK
jgi:hypothetical protein